MSDRLNCVLAPHLSEEYKLCLDIRKVVFVEEQKVPLELEISDEAQSIHFLGRIDEVPVCTGRLRRLLDENILKFERIATLKEFRGQGHGRSRMQALQQYALENYADCKWLMGAQTSALKFYESLGWIKSDSKIFLDAGIEHYWLEYPH